MATSLRLAPDSANAAVAVEKRCGPRRLASQVPSIAGLRLSPYGANATLVNISISGLLAECTVGLKTGSQVTVMFDGDFLPASIASQVIRCAVSAMGSDGLLRYQVGIVFNAPIALDDAIEPESVRADERAERARAFDESDVPLPVSTPVPAVVRNHW
jgi:hypothetical protein